MSNPSWLRRITAAPLFPFLAAAYPVVFLYAQNVHEAIAPLDVLIALGAALGGTLLVFGVLLGLTRRAAVAGLMTTWLVLLFFTYGHMHTWLTDSMVKAPVTHYATLAGWGVIALIGLGIIAVIGNRVRPVVTPLNAIGLIVLTINLVTIGAFALNLRSDPTDTTNPLAGTDPQPQHGTPDIYWLILDRYGSGHVLDEFYDDSNQAFLDALRQRGFYIAEDATANYLKTGLSLVSSRNMEYLDGAALQERASSPGDWGPIYRDLKSPFTVEEFLGSQGYRFIYLGTYWDPTKSHPSAEINYVYDKLGSEFLEVLSRWTVLQSLEELLPHADYDWRRNRWNQTRYEWERLNHATTLDGPKFVHAHFALPHEPYVFHTDGSFVTEAEEKGRTREENYVDQLGFANAQVLDFVDSLLALPEDQRPILIIQADEGPWPIEYLQNEKKFDWTSASEAQLRYKFGILSAFYLPNVPDPEAAGFYSSITPVNQFRVLFNEYFGLDLPLLPDRNYIFPDQEHLYQMIDVTDRFSEGG
jgi:hypothetical protein